MSAPKSICTETERVIRAGKVEAIVDHFIGRPCDPQRAYLECRENYAKLAADSTPASTEAA